MTINANDTSTTPSTPAPAGPTPPLTAYEQLVANLKDAIDALGAQIPELQTPHPAITSFVRSHQNVPLEFTSSAVAAVQDTPILQAANTLDVNEVRGALQFIGAFQPLYEKVSLLAQNLKFTIMERRAQTTFKAQRVYGMAKQLGRDPNSTIAGHVKIMQQHLQKNRRKSTTKSPAPTPAPVTTAPVVVHLAALQEGGVLTQKAA
jgi:hypothetical protein